MRPVVFDQQSWNHIAITGTDRVRFLNGMVTGNISTMRSGDWMRTVMLTHKARVISIFELHAFDEHFLVSCQPDLLQKTFDALDRHIVMDDVELEEREMPMHSVWKTTDEVWTNAPVFEAAPTTPSASSPAEVETRRIEAGLPLYGADASEDNFPFESPLKRLIDYKKGCFAGQEPVARVHARGGGGSKRLCGLRIEGGALVVPGANVSTADKPAGGVVTSAALSESFGSIALAYVHKSAWDSGSRVEIGESKQIAEVVSLPFGS